MQIRDYLRGVIGFDSRMKKPPGKGTSRDGSVPYLKSKDTDPIMTPRIPPSSSAASTAKPTRDQPGTLGQQLAAIDVAIGLGELRDTSARAEREAARRLVIPHVSNGGVR